MLLIVHLIFVLADNGEKLKNEIYLISDVISLLLDHSGLSVGDMFIHIIAMYTTIQTSFSENSDPNFGSTSSSKRPSSCKT